MQNSEPEMIPDPPVGTHQYQKPIKEFKDVREYLAEPLSPKQKGVPTIPLEDNIPTDRTEEVIDVLKCTVRLDTTRN